MSHWLLTCVFTVFKATAPPRRLLKRVHRGVKANRSGLEPPQHGALQDLEAPTPSRTHGSRQTIAAHRLLRLFSALRRWLKDVKGLEID